MNAEPLVGVRHPWCTDFEWQRAVRPPRRLTDAQVDQFDTAGWLVVDNLIEASTLRELTAELDEIEAEADAFIRSQPDDRFVISEADAITFSTHAVLTSATARRVSRLDSITDICHDLIGPDVRLYWDQLVYKKPQKPREFPWHQDNGYTFIEPQQYLTIWLALTDATVDNGCPWVAPGAHRTGTLAHSYVHPLGLQCFFDHPNATAAPVLASSAVVFSSLTSHRTGPNTTDAVRKTYILQFAPDGVEVLRGDPSLGPPTTRELPNLTIESFNAAAFAGEPTRRAVTGPSLSWGVEGIGPDEFEPDYRGVDDTPEIWWDPTAEGPAEGVRHRRCRDDLQRAASRRGPVGLRTNPELTTRSLVCVAISVDRPADFATQTDEGDISAGQNKRTDGVPRPVDQHFDAMLADVRGPRRMHSERHRLANRRCHSGGNLDLSSFEHLRTGGAVGLHEVHDDVDQCRMRLTGRVVQIDLHARRLTNRDSGRDARGTADLQGSVGAEPNHWQRVGVALLDEGAQSVFDKTLAIRTATTPPPTCDRHGHVGMIFGDVVDVVCNRSTDVLRRVVLEQLEQLDDGSRVSHELAEAGCPGQARPCPLRDQSPYVLTRIGRPLSEAIKSGVAMRLDVRTDAELSGEALREFVLHRHRQLEVVEAMDGDEVDQWEVSETFHPVEVLGKPLALERIDHDLQRRAAIGRQRGRQHTRDVSRPRHQFELVEAIDRRSDEPLARESRHDSAEQVGQVGGDLGSE